MGCRKLIAKNENGLFCDSGFSSKFSCNFSGRRVVSIMFIRSVEYRLISKKMCSIFQAVSSVVVVLSEKQSRQIFS